MSTALEAVPVAPGGQTGGSAAKTWLRALELTARIPRERERIFPRAIDEAAARHGDKPALRSDRESLSYRQLAERMHQYARWALAHGLAKGDVVFLLMGNRPEYMAIWLGLSSVGVVVALGNTNLVGASLAHSIDAVRPRAAIVAAEQIEAFLAALPLSEQAAGLELWVHGGYQGPVIRVDIEVDALSGEELGAADEWRNVAIDDVALCIYTSGTTGLPKAARVSHARVMQWTHWFAGMMELTPGDRMYACLPMYHSVGGIQAPGAMLVAGGSVVVREKFSASAFWTDVSKWECTLFQYIGELCRYLLHSPPAAAEREHRLRLACGNGMAPEVWEPFQERFGIPRILEFYAATEGNVSLFNVEGKPGAIGHIPAYLEHRFSPALVPVDHESGELVRNEHGFCVRCRVGEAGEALGKMVEETARIGSRFDGYTSGEASQKRIARDVFETGDAWFRTGDLMRRDEAGFFYFVDRIGDTFRWKGENVATSEVMAVLCEFPGVRHANVYGVAVPEAEGRAGMATLVVDGELGQPGLAQLHQHIAGRLPGYARPLFLRVRPDVAVTGTFKYAKTELVQQGFDPSASPDAIYFDEPGSGAFVVLDQAMYERLRGGGVRL
jgi:fatty-acyl-CoA synthase